MHHYIYAIVALFISMTMSTNLSRGTNHAANRIFVNEVKTQLTGIAYDVLENIERRGVAFDEETDESLQPKPVKFPIIKHVSDLTPANEFGGCTDYGLCNDVDDFHGMTITRTTQGTTFELTLSVRYVDEDDPTVPSTSPTFSKEISALITNPHILINGEPISVIVSRVVTYHRITWKSGIWL